MPRPKKAAPPKRPPIPKIELSQKQAKALHSQADITIFGGGNGGGKTQALVFLPLLPEYLGTPGCSVVLFAETVPKLTQSKGLVDKCKEWYGPFHPQGADGFHGTLRRWTFPAKDGNVSISLSYVGEPGQWDGLEAAVIGVDQLEQTEAKSFFSLVSRNRTTCGARTRVFATANPPAQGRDHWLTKLLTAGGWIGADGYPRAEVDGVVRYFIRSGDDFIFADDPAQLEPLAERDRSGRAIPPKSLTFVQALVDDHPDPKFADDYRQTLAILDEVERLRRLRGNWYVVEEAGKYFTAAMFPRIEYAPSGRARRVRSWDNAWSTSEKADLTPGVLIALEPDGWLTVEDMLCFRGSFEHVERAVMLIAELDGRQVDIRFPKDAGAAGGLQSKLARQLGALGYTVVLTQDRGDKLTRSKPYQGCASRHQIRLGNGHPSADIARLLTLPFEQHEATVHRDHRGNVLPARAIQIAGLDGSNVLTLNGWHAEFVKQHVMFGADTVHKKNIKKDAVDAAVGGYEHLTQQREQLPPAAGFVAAFAELNATYEHEGSSRI